MVDLKQKFDQIDKLTKNVIHKYEMTLELVNKALKQKHKESGKSGKYIPRYYVLKEELEPILSQEEKDFIGFWKGSIKGTPRLTKYCIQKRMNRAVFQTYPEFYKDISRAGRKGY
jgi:hypothetical protein